MTTELDSFLRRALAKEALGRDFAESHVTLSTGTRVRLYFGIHPNAQRAVLIAEVVQPPPYQTRYAAEIQKLRDAVEALPVLRDDQGDEVARVELLVHRTPYRWLTRDEVAEMRGLIEETTPIAEPPWGHHDGWSFAVRPAALWSAAATREDA